MRPLHKDYVIVVNNFQYSRYFLKVLVNILTKFLLKLCQNLFALLKASATFLHT